MSLMISGFGGADEIKPDYEIVSWITGTTAQIEAMLEAAEQGKIDLSDYWSIGQERTSGSINWVLTDFNDTTSGGTSYNAIIHSKNTIENFGMNTSNTNVGGWSSSNMRTTKMASLYNNLEAGFKSLIKQVTNISGAGNQSNTTQTTNDYLWLFSEMEVQGATSYAGSAEAAKCKQMQYFKTADNKKKTGSSTSWWLRSPLVSNATYFCFVNIDGSAYVGNASNACGVVPVAAI